MKPRANASTASAKPRRKKTPRSGTVQPPAKPVLERMSPELRRATLGRAGKTIGYADALISAHAREIDYVGVTDNVSEYRRLSGLVIEIWRAEG